MGGFRRLSKEDRQKYAMKMAEREEREACQDGVCVNRDAQRYQERIQRERERLGLNS